VWEQDLVSGEIGTVIANRVLSLAPGGKVVVTIGQPRPFPGGKNFFCPFKVEGLGHGNITRAGGVDAVQALQLALQMVGTVLYTSQEYKDGRLTWDGGENGSLGFPVAANIRDILPDGDLFGEE
jgi:hypothetical protein